MGHTSSRLNRSSRCLGLKSLGPGGQAPSRLPSPRISPQAEPGEGSLTGLGLTWRSCLLLSAPIYAGDYVAPPDVLRRSVEMISLRPLVPALGTILPLATDDDLITPFGSGDVDPDPSIVESSIHLLVFYEVPGKGSRLDVVRPGAARVVRFAF